MNLPTQYKWLEELNVMPRTIEVGLELLGTAEVVGKGSNRTILAWRDELNLAGVEIAGYSDDDIAWCGLYAAIVCYRRMRNPKEVVKSPLWARNWAQYGVKTSVAALGDVLVFVRNGGGHVGFYIGEDATCYHVLGGNQSNKVCITRIAKNRCIAARRPVYKVKPACVKPYKLSPTGTVSSNEA